MFQPAPHQISARPIRAASTARPRVARRSNFGNFGLKATEPGRVTAREIEAARRAITRHIKRIGRVWISIFPDVPVSRKPAEVRYPRAAARARRNSGSAASSRARIMFELDGVPGPIAHEAFTPGASQAFNRHPRRDPARRGGGGEA